jgi:cytochrome P450
MMLRPDAQEKAHEELQHIVREGRLPDFSDDLPYIQAIAKECIRWNPAAPLGKQLMLTFSC